LADRSISGADRAGMDIGKFTKRHTETFFSDLKKIDITHDSNTYPTASENVDSMIKLTEKPRGKRVMPTKKLRSVYFDISRLDDYGLLSNIDLTNVRHSRTVDQDNYEKDSPVDFTLLKRSTLAELKKVYISRPGGEM